MHTRTSLVAIGLALLLAPASAEAQRRNAVPDTGMVGIAAAIGATVPTDDFFDHGLEVTAGIEGYLAPRLSARALVGRTWWDIEGVRGADTMSPTFVDANLVYNWELGEWHPYATAGIGVYHFKLSGDRGDDTDTKGGFNVGGGIEYFISRETTVTGEVLYHHIGDFQTSGVAFAEGSFWSIAMGLKTYLGR